MTLLGSYMDRGIRVQTHNSMFEAKVWSAVRAPDGAVFWFSRASWTGQGPAFEVLSGRHRGRCPVSHQTGAPEGSGALCL